MQPGEVAVVSRPNASDDWGRMNGIQYVAVLRRTPEQMVFAGTDAEYFVANLVCPHRGFPIGITDNPSMPFSCVQRGSRHASNFDAGGMGVGGASDGDPMSVPAHTLTTDGAVVLTLT